MKLLITNKEYKISNRIKTEGTISYINISPIPSLSINDNIKLLTDDGNFLLCEDNPSNFLYQRIDGNNLILSNYEEIEIPPPSETDMDTFFQNITYGELANAIIEGVNTIG